jgi:4-amino-4-deoxychorismate lyase
LRGIVRAHPELCELARLRRSAQALELPEPGVSRWRAAVELAVQEWG